MKMVVSATGLIGNIYHIKAGLVISNIDIDINIIDDTFDVSISISMILSYKSIDRGIDDTLLAFLYRHYIDTSDLKSFK